MIEDTMKYLWMSRISVLALVKVELMFPILSQDHHMFLNSLG